MSKMSKVSIMSEVSRNGLDFSTENWLDFPTENGGCLFTKSDIFMKMKKMRAVRTIHLQAAACRDLCSEAQS